METYWTQYREHCVARIDAFVTALESLRRQQSALVEFDGNPVWIAKLDRDIAEATSSVESYRVVIARLDAGEQPTG